MADDDVCDSRPIAAVANLSGLRARFLFLHCSIGFSSCGVVRHVFFSADVRRSAS